MDDSRERKAALDTLSKYEEMITEKCKDDPTDIMDALSELKVITQDEMDDATDNEEYGAIMSKFKAQVKHNPNLFLKFCQKVKNSEDFVKQLTGTKVVTQLYELIIMLCMYAVREVTQYS